MSGYTVAILGLGLLFAYLLGSLPTGFLLAKALKGIDIRDYGSGNTGATNVFRVVGKSAGITALAIDLFKGIVAVLAIGGLRQAGLIEPLGDSIAPWFSMLAGMLAILGHSKSVWLGFTGGKSAATSLGVLLALAWPVGLGVAIVFGMALGISRTVSVGSITAAFSATLFMLATQQPLAYILLAVVGGCYVVVRHRSNISRLLAGTEPKTFGS